MRPERGRVRSAALRACLLIFIVTPTFAQAEREREPKAIPAGEVTVVIGEQTFNALLEALFTLPQPPTFPLGQNGSSSGQCAGSITLLREAGGVRTAVRFTGGRITAPIAFRGNYSAPLVGCLKFQGWADTALDPSFDASKQALNARVVVRDVRLDSVPSVFGNGITGLVQDALDARVNPVEILRAEQVSADLPLRKLSSGGALRLRARGVRQEIVGAELRLHIAYEFVRAD